MSHSDLNRLVEALKCLPGVGPRSAQRIAYHLLHKDKNGAAALVKALDRALASIRHCSYCNTLAQVDVCGICSSSKRDKSKLCIVEMPVDVIVLEQTRAYSGLYFVLMGKLSPLDGVGPNEIGFDMLLQRVKEGELAEVIIATSFTSEGEATAHYINQLLGAQRVSIKRIAKGLPVGGELEYSDGSAVAQAFRDRVDIE